MAFTQKKFLDQVGLEKVLEKFQDYPDNEILGVVINAIQDALDNKVDKSLYLELKRRVDELEALPLTHINWNLIYENSDIVLDGTNYLNTDVYFFNPLQYVKIELSITAVTTSSNASNPPTILHCMKEASPYPGINLDLRQNNRPQFNIGQTKILAESTSADQEWYLMYDPDNNKFYARVPGNKIWQEVSYTLGSTVSKPLILGAMLNESGVYSRYWQGTIHNIKIYTAPKEN